MNNKLSEKILDYASAKMTRGVASPHKGRLVVIEGLDGTGKTTAVNTLAEKIGGVALSSPISEIFRSTRAKIEAISSPEEHFRFFYSANAEDSAGILLPAMERGEIVVLDRYEITTLVGHAALNVDLEVEMDALGDARNRIIPADITIFLRLATEERVRRLMERAQTKANSKYDVDTDYQERMANMYRQLMERGMVEADINGLDVGGVAARLTEILKDRKILSPLQ